jgi:hypothetical protein
MRHHIVFVVIVLLSLAACSRGCSSCSPPGAADSGEGGGTWAQASVANYTSQKATAYVSFGTGSAITWWAFCADAGSGICSFSLPPGGSQDLPARGNYLNATVSFNAVPSCGVTVGEVDLSNPSWTADTANISLVNGWSNDIEILATSPDGGSTLLGPTEGPTGNASVFGVYPNGCDVCVGKQNPPCGIKPCGGPDGSPPACGCKLGTQYNPVVPCQAQLERSGQEVVIALVQRDGGVPAGP